MSIQAASVVRRSGEVLLSRQFVEMSSARVHEILAVYPRLLKAGSEQTTLEEVGSRFVFEPLDDVFVVLVSEAEESNILQDIKTLRLLSQLVRQTVSKGAGTVESKDIIDATYSIIDAFDEVVTMGYSENLSASQVETFLRMESHEEKIQEIIERNKQLEAAEDRKKKAKELEIQRKNAQMQGLDHLSAGPSGFGSGSGLRRSASPAPGAFSSSGHGSGISPVSLPYETSAPSATPAASTLKGHGLRLGKKKATAASGPGLPLLADPEPIAVASRPGAGGAAATQPEPTGPATTTTDISIAEQLTIEMTRDGSVKTSRVSGTLNLIAGDREHTKLRIRTSTGGAATAYKPHPMMNRQLFASNRELALKNSNDELPPKHVLLVKWTVDDVPVPITFQCWVSESSDTGFLNVTLEYEVDPAFTGTLSNISVSVPLATSNAHVADPGSNFEQFDDHMVWLIPRASAVEEPTGSFEFVAEADSENDFFPLEVLFSTIEVEGPGALSTFGKIDVDAVLDAEAGTELAFNKIATAQVASYIIR